MKHILAIVLLSMSSLMLASADTPDTPDPLIEPALALAKICVNEASWQSPADCRLIWQVAGTHAPDVAGKVAFLRRHSRCVLGEADHARRPGNCRWSRDLEWGDTPPPQWPEGVSWENHIPRWERVRTLAYDIVRENPSGGPCRGRPVTWGGAMDAERAIARGLVPLTCRETLNQGYARGPRLRRATITGTVSANVARGGGAS